MSTKRYIYREFYNIHGELVEIKKVGYVKKGIDGDYIVWFK